MSVGYIDHEARPAGSFRHLALFYSGMDGFVGPVSRFISEGLAADEPVLVVSDRPKIRALRQELGADADRVQFADMAEVGANPAHIIAAWIAFVEVHRVAGGRLRGVGEPMGPQRSGDELVECERHESLLNVAFAGFTGWSLLCPYDTESLPQAVIGRARQTHPFLTDELGDVTVSADYEGHEASASLFDQPLPDPPANTAVLERSFDAAISMTALRQDVAGFAATAGLERDRVDDALLAVSELVANSLRYGGGSGRLRVWQGDAALVCEVADKGRILDPLAGRQPPWRITEGGRGMWLANRVSDLFQVRTGASGNVVRVHFAHRPQP